ncbi:pyrophosphohydrolase domain-containing protein [Kordiimonas pumila]|uniref:Nucleotide pyrophosphohydrolase n=1 Tax=Kordiimonas pumila TaxID=2161677 RepID=A0ABV7D872_9PROT|nr:nucleotide pyrophosphohydrolase [Kordiimonas pumila]
MTHAHETQSSIQKWADTTFGPAYDQSVLVDRAAIEITELKEAVVNNNLIDIGKEAADVIILLMRLLENYGLDMQDEVTKKMQENRNRKWRAKGDGTGSHVK